MKRYIYTLYASIVVTMLAVIIASAHNIYESKQKADATITATSDTSATAPSLAARDTLSQRFSFRPDSVPVMSYVPLQGPDYSSLDTINAQASRFDGSTPSGRRAVAAERVAFAIDSLVATRSFAFYPSAMQSAAAQQMRMIYTDYYYLYISPVDLEVHIPVEHSPTKYLTMLNFNSNSVTDYRVQKQLSDWVVSFSAATSGSNYDFQLVVSTITGEAELIVASPEISMRYLGTIGRRADIHQSRAAKFFQELGRTNPAASN